MSVYYNPNENKGSKIWKIILIIVAAVTVLLIAAGIIFSDESESASEAVKENTQLKLQISEQQETINKLQLEIDRLNNELANRPQLPEPTQSAAPVESGAPTQVPVMPAGGNAELMQ